MSKASDTHEHFSSGRMVSLDVFRGMTIAGMVLVNNPGSWEHIYPPLEHAAWHGWTPTDLVFPFFLFIVGVSITLSFANRAERTGGARTRLLWKITRRTLIIFALGLFLNGLPDFHLSDIRIPGVLQRIAVCYLIASIIFIKADWKAQATIAASLLLVYWLLMTLVPVPGYGAGDLSREGNLAAYVDRTVFGPHVWKYAKVYDPEGLLSTIPAISTTLFGVLTGHWLRSHRPPVEKAGGMFFVGALAVSLGWVWNFWFPVNKALWTSSYVVFTAGLALQLLGICHWLIEIKNYRRWSKPFVIFGANALALYVFSETLGRLMTLESWSLPLADGATGNLQAFLYEHLFANWAAPLRASLFYAIAYIFFCLFLMWLLYRKNIFIKV